MDLLLVIWSQNACLWSLVIPASWSSSHLFLEMLGFGRIKETWYRSILVEFISEAENGRIFSVLSAFVFAHVDVEVAQLRYVLLFYDIVSEIGEIWTVSIRLFLWKMLCANEIGFHRSSARINWTLHLSKCCLILLRGHWALWNHCFIEIVQTVSVLMVREKGADSIAELLIKSCTLIIVWKGILGFSCLFLFFVHGLVHLWAILIGQLDWILVVLEYVNLIMLFERAWLIACYLTRWMLFLWLNLIFLFVNIRLRYRGFSFRVLSIRLVLLIFVQIFYPCLDVSFRSWGTSVERCHLAEHSKSLHSLARIRKLQSRLFLDHVSFTASRCLNIN